MHLNGGFTRVLLERGATWDIPTDAIPIPLRAIGARFRVVTTFLTPEPPDSAEQVSQAGHPEIRVEELGPDER
jgi:hypothetical protein